MCSGSSPERELAERSRVILSANLTRVNDAARRSRQTRFTALLHHVDVAALERAYRRLRQQAAPGVDGVTVDSYGQDLEGNLSDLADRVRGEGRVQIRCTHVLLFFRFRSHEIAAGGRRMPSILHSRCR